MPDKKQLEVRRVYLGLWFENTVPCDSVDWMAGAWGCLLTFEQIRKQRKGDVRVPVVFSFYLVYYPRSWLVRLPAIRVGLPPLS